MFTDSIEEIKITGDFFIHPEEDLNYLEKCLIKTEVDESEGDLAKKIRNAALSKGIEMIGVDPESIALTVKMAIKNGMESN